MAKTRSMDRLQPCLLNRLTDDEPEAKKESRDQRIMSMSRYRKSILNDLANILNSKSHPLGAEIYEFSDASKSVINYGVRDLCGLTASSLSPGEVESQVQQAIQFFEPRILTNSLSVRMIPSDSESDRSISLEIEGESWAQPVPDHLFVKTEVDMETGHYEFRNNLNG